MSFFLLFMYLSRTDESKEVSKICFNGKIFHIEFSDSHLKNSI